MNAFERDGRIVANKKYINVTVLMLFLRLAHLWFTNKKMSQPLCYSYGLLTSDSQTKKCHSPYVIPTACSPLIHKQKNVTVLMLFLRLAHLWFTNKKMSQPLCYSYGVLTSDSQTKKCHSPYVIPTACSPLMHKQKNVTALMLFLRRAHLWFTNKKMSQPLCYSYGVLTSDAQTKKCHSPYVIPTACSHLIHKQKNVTALMLFLRRAHLWFTNKKMSQPLCYSYGVLTSDAQTKKCHSPYVIPTACSPLMHKQKNVTALMLFLRLAHLWFTNKKMSQPLCYSYGVLTSDSQTKKCHSPYVIRTACSPLIHKQKNVTALMLFLRRAHLWCTNKKNVTALMLFLRRAHLWFTNKKNVTALMLFLRRAHLWCTNKKMSQPLCYSYGVLTSDAQTKKCHSPYVIPTACSPLIHKQKNVTALMLFLRRAHLWFTNKKMSQPLCYSYGVLTSDSQTKKCHSPYVIPTACSPLIHKQKNVTALMLFLRRAHLWCTMAALVPMFLAFW